MQLSLEKDVFHYAIHSCSNEGVWVSSPVQQSIPSDVAQKPDMILQESSFIIAPEVLEPWRRDSVHQLTVTDVEQWVAMKPEIVVLGTGQVHEWPDMAVFEPLYANNIGLEVMSTDAACRTYNLLMSDRRKIIAAIIV